RAREGQSMPRRRAGRGPRTSGLGLRASGYGPVYVSACSSWRPEWLSPRAPRLRVTACLLAPRAKAASCLSARRLRLLRLPEHRPELRRERVAVRNRRGLQETLDGRIRLRILPGGAIHHREPGVGARVLREVLQLFAELLLGLRIPVQP